MKTIIIILILAFVISIVWYAISRLLGIMKNIDNPHTGKYSKDE